MKRVITICMILGLASCEYKAKDLDPTLEGFFTDEQPMAPTPQQFAEAQAARGARADATLGKAHFDGGRLNSLGEDKLSLMLKDDATASPLVVYVNLDEKDALSGSRREAVTAFLKDKGLKADQIAIRSGYNPVSHSPAEPHLKRAGKLETGAGEGGTGAEGNGKSGMSAAGLGASAGSTTK